MYGLNRKTKKQTWSHEDKVALKKLAGNKSIPEIAKQLNKTEKQIKNQATRQHLNLRLVA